MPFAGPFCPIGYPAPAYYMQHSPFIPPGAYPGHVMYLPPPRPWQPTPTPPPTPPPPPPGVSIPYTGTPTPTTQRPLTPTPPAPPPPPGVSIPYPGAPFSPFGSRCITQYPVCPRPPGFPPRPSLMPPSGTGGPAVVTGASTVQFTVYVGKIAPTVDNDFILSLLQVCGVVKSWKPAKNPIDEASTRLGFCEFLSAEGSLRAKRLLNKLSVDGRELVVNINQASRYYLAKCGEKKITEGKAKEAEAEARDGMVSLADTEVDSVTDIDAMLKIHSMIEERMKSKLPGSPTPPVQPSAATVDENADDDTKRRQGSSALEERMDRRLCEKEDHLEEREGTCLQGGKDIEVAAAGKSSLQTDAASSMHVPVEHESRVEDEINHMERDGVHRNSNEERGATLGKVSDHKKSSVPADLGFGSFSSAPAEKVGFGRFSSAPGEEMSFGRFSSTPGEKVVTGPFDLIGLRKLTFVRPVFNDDDMGAIVPIGLQAVHGKSSTGAPNSVELSDSGKRISVSDSREERVHACSDPGEEMGFGRFSSTPGEKVVIGPFDLLGLRKLTFVRSVFNDDDMGSIAPIGLQVVQGKSSTGPPNSVEPSDSAKRISVSDSREERSVENCKSEKVRAIERDAEQVDKYGDGNERRKDIYDQEKDRQETSKSEDKSTSDAKQLLASVPNTKKELFAYDHGLHEKMRPWISKKATAFFGEEFAEFVDYVVATIEEHVEAPRMLELLDSLLSENAEKFVLLMWRKLIFEIKKVETGLA